MRGCSFGNARKVQSISSKIETTLPRLVPAPCTVQYTVSLRIANPSAALTSVKETFQRTVRTKMLPKNVRLIKKLHSEETGIGKKKHNPANDLA